MPIVSEFPFANLVLMLTLMHTNRTVGTDLMVIGLSSMLIWMYSKFKELSMGEKKKGLFMIILASEK